jgi:hypothetical protein
MDFTKETLITISDYLSKFILLLAPGMIVIDFAMQRGFFSGGINTIFDFLLLLFWSAVFSFPYYILAILALFWNEVTVKSDIKRLADKIKGDPTTFETVLIFVFFLILLHYITFRVMLYYRFLVWTTTFGFDHRVVICIVSMFAALLVGFPFSKLLYFALRRIALILGKHILPKDEKTKK